MNLISVIMPYYKKKKFIKSSIESISNQTNQNFEIIIIYDDKSSDDYDYILKFQQLDERIKVIKNEDNIGAGYSRNKGILESKGNFIAFLDCDDYWRKDKLEKQLMFMIENKISFSFTSYNVVNLNNDIIKFNKAPKKIKFNDLIKDCKIGLSTVMLEKNLFNEDCMFPKLTTKEDFVLWLRISKKIDLFGLDEPLVNWRKLNDSLSSNLFQKIKDGYKVYNNYLGLNPIMSIYYLLLLSINYLKKN